MGCAIDGRVGEQNDLKSDSFPVPVTDPDPSVVVVVTAMVDGEEDIGEGGTGDNDGDGSSTGTVLDTRRLHRGLRMFIGTVGCCSITCITK